MRLSVTKSRSELENQIRPNNHKHEPAGQAGLCSSSAVVSLIQNDLFTKILFTNPSIWNGVDLELFDLS